MLKQQIDQDLKKALLAGNTSLATTLRGLKSVILYAEVAAGSRDTGLADEAIIALLGKEAKKRQESADLYTKGGRPERAEAELAEKRVIEAYLPQQLSDDELKQLVDEVATELGATTPQAMGQVIAKVKEKSNGAADGSRIAQAVKERLQV
ncbi:MAG TPA: GatB/YqeY domain-containing protein [Candidatus Saccharimonadales bacterium]|nr:GatB/YqeY domain-containing protein [Candidatus Saccharimonadales bacterium]